MMTCGPDRFETLLDGMCHSPHTINRSAGNNLIQKNEKERLYILSEATRQTAIWDNPCVQCISCHSNFTIEELKDRYVPAEHIDTYTGFLRAVMGVATSAMTRNRRRPRSPVLFLLDQFPILGRMECVETAIGLMAGYGAPFHLYVQNLQ